MNRAPPPTPAASAVATDRRPRYAVVASRWGRHVERRRCSFRMLQHVALWTRRDHACFVVADQTAAQPWVERAAELFQLPVEAVTAENDTNRDQRLIEAADKVFAIWVRRGGTVARLLLEKIRRTAPGNVWVAVSDDPECAGRELVAAGAVGWRGVSSDAPPQSEPPPLAAPRCLDPAEIDWPNYLVHCTRERCGVLPGQSLQAWRDEVLLGGGGGQPAQPLEVLESILEGGWLCGSDRVTRRGQPVICWSAVPLPELIARRIYRPHLGRWDYEPYGVAIRRTALIRLGAEPVIYGPAERRRQLPCKQRWRYQAEGKSGQWKNEQEWRLRGNLALDEIANHEAVVFVRHAEDAKRIAPCCRWPIVAMFP